jgi:hypothetical protein
VFLGHVGFTASGFATADTRDHLDRSVSRFC